MYIRTREATTTAFPKIPRASSAMNPRFLRLPLPVLTLLPLLLLSRAPAQEAPPAGGKPGLALGETPGEDAAANQQQADGVIPGNWNGAVQFTEERNWQSFEVEVGAETAALDLTLSGEGEADLYVRRGEAMQDWSQADFRSLGDGASGRILLDSHDFDGGIQGRWFVDVVSSAPETTRARLQIRQLDALALADQQITLPRKNDAFGVHGDPQQIVSDSATVPLSFDANRSEALVALRVDAGVEAIDIHLAGGDAPEGTDLDLLAAYDRIPDGPLNANASSSGYGAEETIRLARTGTPGLRSGLWYVKIDQFNGGDVELPLEVTYHRAGEVSKPTSLPSEENGVVATLVQQGPFTADFQPGVTHRQFAIDVPQEAESLRITSNAGTRDIDLALFSRGPVDLSSLGDQQNAPKGRVAADVSIDGQELVYLDGDSEQPLQAGRYYLVVTNADAESQLPSVPLELSYDTPPMPQTALVPGEISHQILPRGTQNLAFLVEVPEGTRVLRFAALNATRDVDLFARHGRYVQRLSGRGYDHEQISDRVSEWLTIENEDGSPIEAGAWFFQVTNFMPEDLHTEFDVVATLDAGLPFPALPGLPLPTDQPLTTLESAMQSLVRIDTPGASGSGTFVSPQGHILTNWHVAFDQGHGNLLDDDFLISVTDPAQLDEPPVQLFRARLIEADRLSDVALLEITGDIYDRPLPEGYTFPAVRIGDPELLHHGDALFVAGYPATGGHESRTSITATSGIVSGFNTDETGRRITLKTDAKINAGNSGGAIFNAAGEYVAAPHSEIIIADDELGFAAPVRVLPKTWQEILRAAGCELPWPADSVPAEAASVTAPAAVEPAAVDPATPAPPTPAEPATPVVPEPVAIEADPA